MNPSFGSFPNGAWSGRDGATGRGADAAFRRDRTAGEQTLAVASAVEKE